jgi:hypothetical protein
MNLAAHANSRSTLEAQLEQETKCEPEQAAATVNGLIALGLLDDEVHPTWLLSQAAKRSHRAELGDRDQAFRSPPTASAGGHAGIN